MQARHGKDSEIGSLACTGLLVSDGHSMTLCIIVTPTGSSAACERIDEQPTERHHGDRPAEIFWIHGRKRKAAGRVRRKAAQSNGNRRWPHRTRAEKRRTSMVPSPGRKRKRKRGTLRGMRRRRTRRRAARQNESLKCIVGVGGGASGRKEGGRTDKDQDEEEDEDEDEGGDGVGRCLGAKEKRNEQLALARGKRKGTKQALIDLRAFGGGREAGREGGRARGEDDGCSMRRRRRSRIAEKILLSLLSVLVLDGVDPELVVRKCRSDAPGFARVPAGFASVVRLVGVTPVGFGSSLHRISLTYQQNCCSCHSSLAASFLAPLSPAGRPGWTPVLSSFSRREPYGINSQVLKRIHISCASVCAQGSRIGQLRLRATIFTLPTCR
ncbi:hypothetical protein Mp_1g04310 [Marchantia polymorpha subsp. ruderalis]|uniref:Uncharacterized protein n=2 Tax=Marchantia polymorpha TaxID=3197 RepID=A0AAF6ALE3_MARPO|nr:hypothetical protein MARPO_0005s0176 [Marchantia polymorpha]BBM97263.1 hypothetical protein Mp_1g04310 [Marchantia polymorpha subsp. ruderalis]|eukprot:PTQ48544.1 hypothetical protein MARPO_0005s0176 [Marchantia polymorpha]